jgi:hypothetical protein
MRGSRGDLMLPSAVQEDAWPTPRAAATRTSRTSLVENQHWSAPSLEQAAELAAGILPREFADEAELTPQARRVYERAGTMRQRERTGDLMLPSAVQEDAWPTPTARDWRSGHGSAAHAARNARPLSEVVTREQHALWATPKSVPSGPDYARAERGGSGGDDLATQLARAGAGGQLAPDWVEGLQGLPVGWTDPGVPNEALAPWRGWPAPPGHAQHAFEPPRTGRGIKHRAKRLRALGNLVVPQQAYPVFAAIVAAEAHARTASSAREGDQAMGAAT